MPKYASVNEIILRNELLTVYELHVYNLSELALDCLRGEHSHRSLNDLLHLQSANYSLRSVKRRCHSSVQKNDKFILVADIKRSPWAFSV